MLLISSINAFLVFPSKMMLLMFEEYFMDVVFYCPLISMVLLILFNKY